MKLIELHILQSFPVSCLNRDDVGSPKSAIFGGVPRARISSQSLKRAIRMHAKELAPEGQFEGIRTRHLKKLFVAALESKGIEDVETSANELCAVLSTQDKKKPEQVTTAVYLSPGEIEEIVSAMADGKTAKQAVKGATRKDAADIALFGRMIANDPTLNVDGAAMFSHALSTHKVANEVDFFSAVDENKPNEDGDADAGASMIGTLEFNSALYYRYAALNIDLLSKNLGYPDVDALKNIVTHFIKATLEAVPGARKNSMNANTRPSYVLGTVKLNGQPVQLINAFENPIWSPGKGFTQPSIEKLTEQHSSLAETWGVTCDVESSIPQDNLDTFISTLTAHVS